MSDTDDVPTSLRLPRALVARLDALTERLAADPALASAVSRRVTRSAVLRAAIDRGVSALEADARRGAAGGPVDAADVLAELDALRVKVAALVGSNASKKES